MEGNQSWKTSSTNRLARLAIRYVRSFTDTWAFLVNESLVNDDILAPSNAYVRWKKAMRANNPLLTLSHTVNRNEQNHVSVNFELNIDEANGEYHAAILLIAIDSFLSLLSASSFVKIKSNLDFFSLYVPAEIPLEYLLNNKLGQTGFPIGDSGPFKKWSMINAVKISGNESNEDVLDRLETVDGDTISAAIRATKKTNKYLDDSEMSRCLAFNKKNGKCEMYTVSSDRNANNFPSLEAAITQKKNRRKRDMSANPALFVEKFVSPKRRKLMAAAMCKGVSKGKKKDSSNHKFTSMLMSAKEFSIAFNSSSSLRGAQRTKSLITKYISLLKTNFSKAPKNNSEGILSRWRSPEGRSIVVVGDCKHHMETIGFSVTCKKSELFKSLSSLRVLLRQWMKVSSEIHSEITHVGKNIPKMKTVADVLRSNLEKTSRTMVRGVRPISSFKVPPCFASNDVSTLLGSTMGIENERYTKIVEVFDSLMSRGVFVNAALNFMFFDNCIDECPPNIDVFELSSQCMSAQFPEKKLIWDFVNTSQDFRSRNRLPHELTEKCRSDISTILSTQGAIAAFNNTTIKKEVSCSDVVIPALEQPKAESTVVSAIVVASVLTVATLANTSKQSL